MEMEERGSDCNRIKRQRCVENETFNGNAYEEALEKERKLVASLKQEIVHRDEKILKLQQINGQTTASFGKVVNGLKEKIRIKDKKMEETESLYELALDILVDEKAELNEAHVSEIRKLQSQNLELDTILRWKSTAFEESKTQRYLERTRLEKEIKELEEILQNQNADNNNLESQISVLKTELEEKLMALQSLESLNNTLVDKELESRQELLEARNESTSLRTELEEKSETMQEERKLAASLKQEIEYRDQSIASFQQVVYGLAKKINIKAELNKAHVSEIRKPQSQNMELDSRLRRISTALEESKTQRYLERTRLENEIKELKEKLQNQNASEIGINSLESRISILKTELDEKLMAFQSLESLNKTLVNQALESRQELLEARKEFITMKTEFEEVHVSEFEKLQSQNMELDSRLQLKSLALEISKSQQYLDCTRLEKEIKELKETLVNKELEGRQELQEARNESTALRTELEKKTEKLQSLECLYNTLVLKDLKCIEQLLEARTESTTLRTELEEKSEKLQSLALQELRSTHELQEARNECINLSAELLEKCETLKYQQSLNNSLYKEMEEKLQNLNATEIANNNLESQITILKTELEEKYEALQSLESLNNTMALKELESKQELHEARNESMALRAELEEKSKTFQYHQSLNNTLIKEMEEKLQNLNATEVANNNLESQITILKTELEEKSDALQSSESLNTTLVLIVLGIRQRLLEARNELEASESLNNILMLKELMSRNELLAARKESITSLKELLGNRATLVYKKLGEIDHKAFQEACLRMFPNDNWEVKSAKLCSLWQEYLTDANWQPFKKVDINGKTVEIVDEDEEKLKELREEYGEAVYNTVANALMELNEHNPSGRYLVPEIWNSREERIATMKEIVQYLVNQVKTHKRKRHYA